MSARHTISIVAVALLASSVSHGARRTKPAMTTPTSYDVVAGASATPAGMDGAPRATNATQGFEAWFGTERIAVRSLAQSDTQWTVDLALVGLGREGQIAAVGPATVRFSGSRADLERSAVEEWYENGPSGLEQGLTIADRPAPDGHRVVVELELATHGLQPLPGSGGRSVVFVRPGSRLASLHYRDLEVIDSDGRELPSSMELQVDVERSRIRLVFDDRNAHYPIQVDPLISTAVWTSPLGSYPTSFSWGDWDGDGDLDLAECSYDAPTRVFEHVDNTLVPVWSSTDSDDTAAIDWGDFDGDGDLDLAAANAGQPNRVYENVGGNPVAVWASEDADTTWTVTWGDVDGDGDLDLAAANGTQPIRIYENRDGSLVSTWTSAEADYTVAIAWGDWDGDGDLDLAVGNYDYDDTQHTRVYSNNHGILTVAWTSGETDPTTAVAWGDWDGDGDLDLACGNDFSPIRIYRNDGGTMASAWTSSETDSVASLAWGDWDGDGDLDLAAGGQDLPGRVYQNEGGTLNVAWEAPVLGGTEALAWGDWDGDGDLDLVTRIGWYTGIYENVGGQMAMAWESADSERTNSVAWGDWDGDGDLDLAAGNDSWPPVQVYANDAGSMTAAWDLLAGSQSVGSVAWGDWDGDFDLDLAVATERANFVYVNDNGTFSPEWSSDDVSDTASIAWGDWDGDGDLDLAAGNSFGFTSVVYENDGGAMDIAWDSLDSAETTSVAWGDWDDDGDLDLAVGNFERPIRVYDHHDGDLTSAWTDQQTDLTSGIAWGDWDGDGDLDLMVANQWSPETHGDRLYQNVGDALTLGWTAPADVGSLSLAWGDWDGDGDLDLATGTGGLNQIYENRAGTLTQVWSAVDNDATLSVAWGDWDGDGDLDLATGNFDAPVRIYRNGHVSRPGGLPETPASPVIPYRPGPTPAAFGYSAECLGETPIVLEYNLVDEEGDPARRVRVEYSPAGGGLWLPATEAGGDGLQDLAASSTGSPHLFAWDNVADGVLEEPWVTLRVTVPSQASTRLAGPVQRAAMSATSPPFSVCVRTADLIVSLDDGQTWATPGTTVSYSLRIANAGPDDAIGVTVVSNVPSMIGEATWSCAADGGGGMCGAATGVGDIDQVVELPSGGSVVFSLSGALDPAATGVLTWTATAQPPGTIHELEPSDNTDTDTDTLFDPVPIFRDNFESGTTAPWSTQVP